MRPTLWGKLQHHSVRVCVRAERLCGGCLTVIVEVGEGERVVEERAENLRDFCGHRLREGSSGTRRGRRGRSRQQVGAGWR